MNNEQEYLDLLSKIIRLGTATDDRTGVGTISLFGHQMRFNLKESFPLITTKKVFFKGIVVELLWMLRGETNTKFLHKYNVKIWDSWVKDEDGNLGPVYGKQMRDFGGVDQIQEVINQIKTNPTSRRLVVSMWNPTETNQMALPPCPALFQFKVYNGTLSCHLYQRSADAFLGVPFDIASYSLLTHLIANECGLEVGEFIHSFGDVHIYKNHINQVMEQLEREPLPQPQLKLHIKQNDLMKFINYCDDFSWEGLSTIIELQKYNSHATIKAEIAV